MNHPRGKPRGITAEVLADPYGKFCTLVAYPNFLHITDNVILNNTHCHPKLVSGSRSNFALLGQKLNPKTD